ncbi:unnamed protein product (macronuclear) [Paramecium tetraurelia]|uniref:Uncharacterized protein n=1 Tax=Paramecium tetraurelia TaxID=5888 RepID=A0BWW2_PARTE|nr:uncharacterized protein GSPATT00032881001 [Paramecium tetraurelia]CAK63029.1 unnamed protein product [Paramecium tetraurelia]|eukprot:XP_001430427.1 hypothetical protein (macronuclear) [Paramecium tetraurelia strain d4-2]
MNHSLYAVHPNYTPINLRLAEEYFNTLPPGDISKQFYDGVQYRAVKGLFASYALNRFSQYGKLNSLYKFYPYQKIVKETKEELCEDWTSNIQLAAIVTGASWTFLYQYAKRGQVLSILREYGSVLKTHRLFRQYLYTLVLPFAIANEYTFVHYHDHIEQLWQVHANRLNKKDLSDPTGTQYPEELRAPRRDVFINKWH